MPDISMCKDKNCPKRDTCYRFTAKPTMDWQSYGDFKWERKKKGTGLSGCTDYWGIIK
jgi:hypothetical protein